MCLEGGGFINDNPAAAQAIGQGIHATAQYRAGQEANQPRDLSGLGTGGSSRLGGGILGAANALSAPRYDDKDRRGFI